MTYGNDESSTAKPSKSGSPALKLSAAQGTAALPQSVRYVKNGGGGKWWQTAEAKGELHTGWSSIPREMLAKRDYASIREALRLEFGQRAGATQDYNALVLLLDHPSQHIWVTFQDGYLWWCTVKDDLRFSDGGQTADRGNFWLTCDIPWSNRSVGGALLAITDLPGAVAAAAGFRATVCQPKAWRQFLRLIQDETDDAALEAAAAREAYEKSIAALISRLGWKDFEDLIDLILLRAGWSRISTLGKTKEGIDLAVENLAVGETAFVQIKSRADQSTLNDYVARFSKQRESYARMIFAVHTPAGALSPPLQLPVQVWTGANIANRAVRVGLGEWIEKRLA
jgi:hypothetical protein